MIKAKEKKENYKKLAIVLILLFLIVGVLSSGIMPGKKEKIGKVGKKNKFKHRWYYGNYHFNISLSTKKLLFYQFFTAKFFYVWVFFLSFID